MAIPASIYCPSCIKAAIPSHNFDVQTLTAVRQRNRNERLISPDTSAERPSLANAMHKNTVQSVVL